MAAMEQEEKIIRRFNVTNCQVPDPVPHFRLEQKLLVGISTHWDIAAFPRRTPSTVIL